MRDAKNVEESLRYHKEPRPGKVGMHATKSCSTQRDLSKAYTPGVAEPCKRIYETPETVWDYTNRCNTVAVISDGTAVLGLGNIGPDASMPVMEGKAVLFKQFAGIDSIPICLKNVHDDKGNTIEKKVIEIVAAMEPSFGGINLEDIGGPACFEIENRLIDDMDIPVFHDDQHGTAIISLAGVINALQMVDKTMAEATFVVNGAGAAGIACARFYISAGAKPENIIMCDSKGVLYKGRTERMSPEKESMAVDTSARTLEEAMEGADVFIGLSKGECVTADMIRKMADKPLIFAMANPVPEIWPEQAKEAGAAVIATGRSDFVNQVNNVLGFPGIFRGALDVRATTINQEMKVAASKALAELVRHPVPADVKAYLAQAYPEDYEAGMFDGDVPLKPEFVIPKPFDPRVVPHVARKVVEAAMATGVNRVKIFDLDAYERKVAEFVGQETA